MAAQRSILSIADRVVSSAIVLIGTAHALLTPTFYKGWTEASFWFLAAGLWLITVGLIRFMAKAREASPRLSLITTLPAALFALAFTAVYPLPQAVVLAVLLVAAVALDLLASRSGRDRAAG